MSYRIFLTGSGIAPEAEEILRQRGCLVERARPEDSPEELARRFRDFDPHGVIVRQGRITRSVQESAKSLRVICKHGVGVDNIDVEAATELGIHVLFTPGANCQAAAEHTLALMLAVARRASVEDRRIRAGIFDKKHYVGLELQGKALGLIGFGRIGRRVADLVGSLGMHVVAYHPSATAEALPSHVSKVPALEPLLQEVDIVSLHCPLTPDTRGLICERTIALMKQGVILINTSRGGVIDESDLVTALQTGRIAGAGLDVFQVEPLAPDHPLLGFDSVVVTPHVAGVSDASFRNMGRQAVEHVLAVLDGRPVDPRAVLNSPST